MLDELGPVPIAFLLAEPIGADLAHGEHDRRCRAKVVLVGDPQQLQAIEAGAAFRAIHERHGGVEITKVRRQVHNWQQDATRHLATGRTGEAIAAYADKGMVHAADRTLLEQMNAIVEMTS